MGGPVAARADQPIKPAYLEMLEVFDHKTGEITKRAKLENKYGERPAAKIVGVLVDGVYHVTRWHTWEIEPRFSINDQPSPGVLIQDFDKWLMENQQVGAEIEKAGGAVAFVADGYEWERLQHVDSPELLGAGAFAADKPPWSSVNNCTP